MASAMYPRPPILAKVKRDNPAETFWIIKHGFKMSGMPAWGSSHDDERIWAMVAFLQQLPRLTPAQYQILTARSADDMDRHAHGDKAKGTAMPHRDPTSHDVNDTAGDHDHGLNGAP